MLGEHPNISILKQFNPENPSSAAGVLAKDFVWHYINPELTELEGDYFGLSGLMDFSKKLGWGAYRRIIYGKTVIHNPNWRSNTDHTCQRHDVT